MILDASADEAAPSIGGRCRRWPISFRCRRGRSLCRNRVCSGGADKKTVTGRGPSGRRGNSSAHAGARPAARRAGKAIVAMGRITSQRTHRRRRDKARRAQPPRSRSNMRRKRVEGAVGHAAAGIRCGSASVRDGYERERMQRNPGGRRRREWRPRDGRCPESAPNGGTAAADRARSMKRGGGR